MNNALLKTEDINVNLYALINLIKIHNNFMTAYNLSIITAIFIVRSK